MKTRTALIAVTLAAVAGVSGAACLTDDQAQQLASHVLAGTPAPNPENLTEEDGACTRAKLHRILQQRYSGVAGYKAGLTNPAVQKRFNYDKPVWGRLYAGMVLEDGKLLAVSIGNLACCVSVLVLAANRRRPVRSSRTG